MSGLINQVGSKSGIIGTGSDHRSGAFGVTTTQGGTTQLDYEEGTWTPTKVAVYGFTDGTEVFTGKYIKIGSLVYLSFVLDWDTTDVPAADDRWRIGNIPFLSLTTQDFIGHGVYVQPGSWASDTNMQGICTAEMDEVFGHNVKINGSPPNYGTTSLCGAVTYQTP